MKRWRNFTHEIDAEIDAYKRWRTVARKYEIKVPEFLHEKRIAKVDLSRSIVEKRRNIRSFYII